MASSQIEAIFDAVANVEVTVGGETVTGRTLAETSTVVNITPVRIISPLSDKNEGKKASAFTIGKQFIVDWTITDLLLWRNVQDGTGLEDDMKYLVDYLGAYVDAMRTNRKLGFSAHVTIESVDVEVGVYQYPIASDEFYHGVKASLQIREIIP